MKNYRRWTLSEGFLVGNNLDDVGTSDSVEGVGIGSAFSHYNDQPFLRR
jgi:hypothetical protein